MRWRLRHPDIARDDGVVDPVAHEAAHVAGHLLGEVVAAIEHGQHDAVHLQHRVEAAAHPLDGPQQQAQAFEREELALQRDQHGVRRRQRVDGQQPKRRRAVDQDVVVGAAERGEGVTQAVGAARVADQLDFCRRQIHGRGHEIDLGHLGGQHGGVERRPRGAARRRRSARRLGTRDAETRAGIALRVEVDDQDAAAGRAQGGAQIDRGRGLADTALLVRDGEYPGAGEVAAHGTTDLA